MQKKIKIAMGKETMKKRYFGHLSLMKTDFPGLKDVDIHDELTVEVKIKITGLSMPSEWDISEGKATKNDITLNSEILSVKGKNASK